MSVDWYSYVLSTCIVVVVAMLTSLSMRHRTSSQWYECIKPSITPPKFVFPVVWTLLYVIIAYALGYAISKRDQTICALFLLNFICSILWGVLYFGRMNAAAAFPSIVVIWASIIGIIYVSRKKMYRNIMWCMVPYLLWVSFAMVLNGLSIGKSSKC